MKTIITALNNPKINEKIKKETEYKLILPDIQYQEGVIEMLEKNGTADILILSGLLPGENELKEFVNKIKEIKFDIEIIIILEEENIEIKNFLISKGVFNIFYNNKTTISEIINLLKEKENKIPEEINQEIKLLKEMILSNKKINNKIKTKKTENIKNKLKKIINKTKNIKLILSKILNKNKTIKNKTNKVICVIGTYGVGKTIFSYIFSNIIKNKKILLIDLDFLNNNIYTILGINKKENRLNLNEKNIEKIIIKKNKNLSLICGYELISENEINDIDIKKIINVLSSNYDVIIIDTPSKADIRYLEKIIKNSNQLILLVEPNLLGIKKSQKLLELYINKLQIEKEKINIVFNKYNINSISDLILNNLFSDFNILGKITLNNNYDLIINRNKIIINKKIKKQYLNIIKKLNLK